MRISSFLFILSAILSVAVSAQTVVTSIQVRNLGASALTNVPVTLGHPFVIGDVPGGIAVQQGTTTLPTQMDVKTRHTDGSINHAILSFTVPSLAASQTASFSLVTSSLNSTTSAITKAAVLATDFDAIASFKVLRYDSTGAHWDTNTCSVSARDLLNNATTPETWLSGPVVTEYLLAGAPKNSGGVADSALYVQFQVRFYSLDRAWVSVVVENDWANYRKTIKYDVAVKLGHAAQTTVISQDTLTQYHDTRWRRTFWWNGSPGNTIVKFDKNYLASTGAIRYYDSTIIVPADVSDFGDTTLMGNGTLPKYQPASGGGPMRGLEPNWATGYFLSCLPGWFKETYMDGQQGGAFPTHFRDPLTLKIWDLEAHPTSTLYNTSSQSPADYLPPPIGTDGDFVPDRGHLPDINYVPYLLTGEYFFLEEGAFWSNWCSLCRPISAHQGKGMQIDYYGARYTAWPLRTMANTAFIEPDGSFEKGYFTRQVQNNIDTLTLQYMNHPLGYYYVGDPAEQNPDAPCFGPFASKSHAVSPWMNDFFTIVADQILNLGFESIRPFRDYLATFSAGRVAHAPDYNPYNSCPYRMAVLDTAGHNFTTWADLYRAQHGGCPDTESYFSGLYCGQDYRWILKAAVTGAARDSVVKGPEAWEFFKVAVPGPCPDYPAWSIVPGPKLKPHPVAMEAGRVLHVANRELSLEATPNPFNPTITLGLHGIKGEARLFVYNITGRKVADLSDKVRDNKVVWNAARLPSGFYVVKLVAGKQTVVKKVTLLK